MTSPVAELTLVQWEAVRHYMVRRQADARAVGGSSSDALLSLN